MTLIPALPRRLAAARAFALLSALALAACGAPGGRPGIDPATGVSSIPPAPEVVARYQSVQDADILIPAVEPGYLTGQNPRTEVYYTGPDAPGTIVVDPHARVLYYIMEGGRAMRYGIAVGREGYGFSGDAYVGRKQAWPSWTPTKNMIRREPEIYGTNNASTIGRATSAGCIRLFNQDILDLFERVPTGTHVHVRSAEESAIAEDPMVENAHGLMVPLSSFPEDVQAQIRAGNIPWPKFVPPVGVVTPESAATGTAVAIDPATGMPLSDASSVTDPDGVFTQLN